MANPIVVTLSSVGVSRHVNLDWRSGAKTAFTITGSSSGTFSVTPEGTVQDLQLTTSPSWVALSSAALTTNSSIWEISGPLAAIRMNASALSSAVFTLNVLQDHGY
jgi:hypothetical protein